MLEVVIVSLFFIAIYFYQENKKFQKQLMVELSKKDEPLFTENSFPFNQDALFFLKASSSKKEFASYINFFKEQLKFDEERMTYDEFNDQKITLSNMHRLKKVTDWSTENSLWYDDAKSSYAKVNTSYTYKRNELYKYINS
ncbi:hypothetical protein [Flammeovirga aprica]|nr:hypothetical protein [Flammeovirga aprica]